MELQKNKSCWRIQHGVSPKSIFIILFDGDN